MAPSATPPGPGVGCGKKPSSGRDDSALEARRVWCSVQPQEIRCEEGSITRCRWRPVISHDAARTADRQSPRDPSHDNQHDRPGQPSGARRSPGCHPCTPADKRSNPNQHADDERENETTVCVRHGDEGSFDQSAPEERQAERRATYTVRRPRAHKCTPVPGFCTASGHQAAQFLELARPVSGSLVVAGRTTRAGVHIPAQRFGHVGFSPRHCLGVGIERPEQAHSTQYGHTAGVASTWSTQLGRASTWLVSSPCSSMAEHSGDYRKQARGRPRP